MSPSTKEVDPMGPWWATNPASWPGIPVSSSGFGPVAACCGCCAPTGRAAETTRQQERKAALEAMKRDLEDRLSRLQEELDKA